MLCFFSVIKGMMSSNLNCFQSASLDEDCETALLLLQVHDQ